MPGCGLMRAPPRSRNAVHVDVAIPWTEMGHSIVHLPFDWEASEVAKDLQQASVRVFENRHISVILSTDRFGLKILGELSSTHAYCFVLQLEVLSHADLLITDGGRSNIRGHVFWCTNGLGSCTYVRTNTTPTSGRKQGGYRRNTKCALLGRLPENPEVILR